MDAAQIQAIHSLIDDLQSAADSAADALIHAQNVDYVVPSINPEELDEGDFSSGDWNGSAAVDSYPDPSAEDTDVQTFRENYLLAPESGSDAAGNKTAYKLPIRNSHGGQINQNALDAVIAAINGARGGVEGVSTDTLRSAYQKAVKLQVAAGEYDSTEEARDFAPATEGSDMQASEPFACQIEAAADSQAPEADPDAAGLHGIIWASGTHDLWVNGEATRVHVPEETIPETFERLQQRMQAGEPPKIGFDHPDQDSVAAQTPLGEIGVAREFAQASDGDRETIVMQESEFTNNKAVEAAEAGSFDGMGFSIVGNIALATDQDGQPKKNDEGALLVEGTEIQRIDVVPDQAVEGAKHGNLEPLASAAAAAGQVAADSPNQSPDGFVRTLRAAAGSIEDPDANASHMTDGTDGDDFPTDPDDLEAAKSALTQASDVVEQKQEKIEELQAEKSDLEDQAEHFRQIAASQGVDPDSDDFEAQQVIDAFTEDLRAEIADLEAALPKYDTEDREARSEELEGKPISELEAMAGERWREFGRSKAKRDELNAAVAASEEVGSVEAAGGSGNGSDADEAAQEVLRARELAEAQDAGQSPAEYVEAQFGIERTEYDSPAELQAQMSGGAN